MKQKEINGTYWRTVLGEDWAHLMKDFLLGDDSDGIYTELYEDFEKAQLLPKFDDVFRAFTLTPLKETRVIIVGTEPYLQQGTPTGLAFANRKDSFSFSVALMKVWEAIEGTYFIPHFDTTLEYFAKQGVLWLNTALTVKENHSLSRIHVWKKWTEHLFLNLNVHHSGIIYCFWGEKAQEYARYINPKTNTILKFDNPEDSVYRGKLWPCPHFTEINKILVGANGEEFAIDWQCDKLIPH